jgi:peptidoglycan/xylan/chitin deacetylase (PgdA/CDA1 family)
MNLRLLLSVLAAAAVLLGNSVVSAQNTRKTERSVAITLDDLPVVSTRKDLATRQAITRKLLDHIRDFHIPAIGFVNEGKLYNDAGVRDEAQVDLLRSWIAAGLELGNHSYSHKSLNQFPLVDYEADLLKGEPITRELLEQHGLKLRYFRHPFLHTGRSLEIRDEFNVFLKDHGYRVAPVTFDNGDWIFARAYDNAIDSKNEKLRRQIAAAYIPYLNTKVDYWERQSVAVLGYEMKQIFLLHANSINAEMLGEIAKMLQHRHYKFISIDEALTDPAWNSPDTFIGAGGISWIHRWALTKGRQYLLPNEPNVPEFVMKAAGVDSE